jgi:hypothetical protein
VNSFQIRISGILGLGAIWSLVWAVVGVVWGAVLGFAGARFLPEAIVRQQQFALALTGAAFFAIYGFTVGTMFGIVLSLAERRRTLERLRASRLALLGGVAGLLVAMTIMIASRSTEAFAPGVIGQVAGIAGVLGAGCAAASLKLARSAPRADNKPVSSGTALSTLVSAEPPSVAREAGRGR